MTGLLFAIFYILTALATIFYCRRRVFGGFWDFLIPACCRWAPPGSSAGCSSSRCNPQPPRESYNPTERG